MGDCGTISQVDRESGASADVREMKEPENELFDKERTRRLRRVNDARSGMFPVNSLDLTSKRDMFVNVFKSKRLPDLLIRLAKRDSYRCFRAYN